MQLHQLSDPDSFLQLKDVQIVDRLACVGDAEQLEPFPPQTDVCEIEEKGKWRRLMSSFQVKMEELVNSAHN